MFERRLILRDGPEGIESQCQGPECKAKVKRIRGVRDAGRSERKITAEK